MAGPKATPRRERILSAAVREFAHNGLAGARIEKIAAAAGVNKQLLFHYFGSKDGLYRAALESVLAAASEARAGGSPVERLTRLVAQSSATMESHPALLSLLAAKGTGEPAVEVVRSWRRSTMSAARGILEDGQRAGYVRDDIDVDAVAEVVVGAALGCAAAGDQTAAGRLEKYVDTLLKMTADYCAWR